MTKPSTADLINSLKGLERKVEWMHTIASSLSAANLELGEMPDGVIRCDEYTIRAIFDGFREELSDVSEGLYRLSSDLAAHDQAHRNENRLPEPTNDQ